MSLDVYLEGDKLATAQPMERIFIREGGMTKEITREEWGDRFPGTEPMTCETTHDYLYSANITHNLGGMAAEAGIYQHLWRPDEIGVTHARQLIEPLEVGLALMKAEPSRFEKHNPSNGWGSYDGFVPWVERYLEACRQYPDATVRVSR